MHYVMPIILCSFLLAINPGFSQIVDIESTDQGLIIPRLTDTSQVNSPAAGMIMYQMSDQSGIYHHDGNKWSRLHDSTSLWKLINQDIFYDAGDVAIGTDQHDGRLTVSGQNGNTVAIEGSNTATALEVTGTGNGDIIRVNDGNAAVFKIDADGMVKIGEGNTSTLSVQSSSIETDPTVSIDAFRDDPTHFALDVETHSGGSAAVFQATDINDSGDGIFARVRGSGTAGIFQSEGVGNAITANVTSTGYIARFQKSDADVVVIDNQGELGLGTSAPSTILDARESSGSANVVNFERTSAGVANSDMLQIEGHAEADDNIQFIECERGTDIEFRVWGDGDVTADGTYSGPADFAELIRVDEGASQVEAGDVVVIDPNNHRTVKCSDAPRSTLVAGVYSTKPGYLGSEHDWDEMTDQLFPDYRREDGEARAVKPMEMAKMIDEIPVAVVGIVPCKVSAENGGIRPGDLLVTSNLKGHAMRDENPSVGTVVGKSLGVLKSGTGVIKILVTLH